MRCFVSAEVRPKLRSGSRTRWGWLHLRQLGMINKGMVLTEGTVAIKPGDKERGGSHLGSDSKGGCVE